NMPDLLVVAGVVPRICGSTLILDVHDPMPELFMSWGRSRRHAIVRLLRWQEKISCRLADYVLSVNDSMRANLSAKGIDANKIFIVNNFPDLRMFPLNGLPSSWPRRKDRLVILYCGTVTEHYDVGLAIRVMARLAGEIPITLRILGEGNRLDEVLDLA